MTDSLRTLETLVDRVTRHVHGTATRVDTGATGARIVATGQAGDAVFAIGTPMELLARITNGSFRNWLVALRDAAGRAG